MNPLCGTQLEPCPAPPGGCDFEVFPPHAEVEGRLLGDWGAEWWKWALEIPAIRNPITDPDGRFCHEGQNPDSSVFFLGGSFGEPVRRECTIPCGKNIFFALLNDFENAPEVAACNVSCPACRTVPRSIIDTAELVSLEIDGCPVSDLGDHREEASDCFPVDLPDDNVVRLPPGLRYPVASDGFWIMLKPLSPGEHTIRFRGRVTQPCFDTCDVLFCLTVEPCGLFRRGDSNVDGETNLTDAVSILEHLFGGKTADCKDANDADDSGLVDLTDAVFLLNHLFRGGEAPPSPGLDECGADPTDDDFTECASACP